MADRESTTGPPTAAEAGTKRKRPWLRRVGVVVGCLLAGATINVLVAWGFAAQSVTYAKLSGHYSGYGWNWRELSDREQQFTGYVATAYRPVGVHRIEVTRLFAASGKPADTTSSFENIIPSWALFALDIPELKSNVQENGHFSNDEMFNYTSIVDARGWPLQSMWGVFKKPRYGVQADPKTFWMIVLDDAGGTSSPHEIRSIPLRPLWSGFMINTVLYGTFAWMLFAAPQVVRRHRRAKKRLCPDCGYDLRGADHGKCPECGEAVTAK